MENLLQYFCSLLYMYSQSILLVLLQVEPSVVLVSSRHDDSLRDVLMSYGSRYYSNDHVVVCVSAAEPTAKNPPNDDATKDSTASTATPIADVEILPSNEFSKAIWGGAGLGGVAPSKDVSQITTMVK